MKTLIVFVLHILQNFVYYIRSNKIRAKSIIYKLIFLKIYILFEICMNDFKYMIFSYCLIIDKSTYFWNIGKTEIINLFMNLHDSVIVFDIFFSIDRIYNIIKLYQNSNLINTILIILEIIKKKTKIKKEKIYQLIWLYFYKTKILNADILLSIYQLKTTNYSHSLLYYFDIEDKK